MEVRTSWENDCDAERSGARLDVCKACLWGVDKVEVGEEQKCLGTLRLSGRALNGSPGRRAERAGTRAITEAVPSQTIQ